MIVLENQVQEKLRGFLQETSQPYLFVVGDAYTCLRLMPDNSIDTVITSPPYWQQREYLDRLAIGQEATIEVYVASLLNVFAQVKRILKPTGSFWLNLGDSYKDKNLCGIPWRVAIALQDTQQWILRNSIVWNKLKGNPDNAKDKLRNTYEFVFHFVQQKKYYYNLDAVRHAPATASVRNGTVVTATGVSGINYRRQIQRSTHLSDVEKRKALQALDATLQKVANGEIPDFRMVIRGQQRTTHSNSTKVSGRAAELERNGFYILQYDGNGSKPGDIWEIVPEDEWRTDSHYAPFPEELCIKPIKLTCPPEGIVLDPFAGTGTAILSAIKLGRRGIGIDISRQYLETANQRAKHYQPVLFRDELTGSVAEDIVDS